MKILLMFSFLISILGLIQAETKPNVILIMADDLGYTDLSCYGNKVMKTPALDQMAEEGMRLTNFHAGSAICTPSRMALLTGAYPSRVGWVKGVMGYMISTEQGLSPDALTIAEVFKSQGYATAISGKWHVGDLEKFLPFSQGFDSTYYIPKSNNQCREILVKNKVVEKFNNRLLSERFTDEAIRFIKEKKDKPFFLYLPYTAPHFPVQAHPDWKGKSKFGEYGDVIEELDFRIGQIMKTLKEQKIDKNTMVIFTSDNGHQPGRQGYPKEYRQGKKKIPQNYRGMKWDSLEGGTKVPFIIRYPGVIPAGQVSKALVSAIDVLPTLSHACGIDLNKLSEGKPMIDGKNNWQSILGKDPIGRKNLMIWHGFDGFHAIRAGSWKLFLNRKGLVKLSHGNRPLNIPASLKPLYEGKGPALFNLEKDSYEMKDLSSQYPEKVKELQALAMKQLKEIEKNSIPLGE